MSIVQRRKSYQVTINRDGRRYRRQFSTRLEAQVWESSARRALDAGGLPERSTAAGREYRIRTIGELAEYLLVHRWHGTKNEKGATINLRHVVRLLDSKTQLRSISAHTINLLVAALRDSGCPDATINKKLSPLRVCLRYAEREGWIERVPNMPFFRQGEGRLRWFNRAEEDAMLGWCRATLQLDLLDYVIVSMDTGLRQGEVLQLRNRNIHDGRVTVWGARSATEKGTKAGNTRTIPLTPRAREALERRALDNPGLLFGFTKDQLAQKWNRMRAELGFTSDPEFVPHSMRHTFCSRLVMNGVNLLIVQRLAGHLRIETTCRYVHLDDQALLSAVASLAR